MASEASKLVSAGMKRICADLNPRLVARGFKKKGARAWTREGGDKIQTVHLQRGGASYGAPRNNSVDIRVMLSVRRKEGDERIASSPITSDFMRKANGYTYHHRFNAKSWSTYDRCLEELEMFVVDVGEPWFQEMADK